MPSRPPHRCRRRVTTFPAAAWWPAVTLGAGLVLWAVSLAQLDAGSLGRFGLVSNLPVAYFAGIAIAAAGFVLALHRGMRPLLLAAHGALLLLMLHATPAIGYAELRYAWAWKHVGVVDMLQHRHTLTGGTAVLDIYRHWPGFFAAAAALVDGTGVKSALSFASWGPPFFALLDAALLVVALRALTDDRRRIALAVWVFMIANWVGQDYFAPQAFGFALYLAIIAIVLQWYRTPGAVTERFRAGSVEPPGPEAIAPHGTAPQRRSVAVIFLVLLAATATSHPLTPIVVCLSLGALRVFRVLDRRWPLVASVVVTVGWLLTGAGTYTLQNIRSLFDQVGRLGSNVDSNLASFGSLSPAQHVVADMGRMVVAVVALLAVAGFARRVRHGYVDRAAVALCIAPGLLLAAGAYGGEAIFHAYLFALPFAAFLAAGLFYPSIHARAAWGHTVGIAVVTCALLTGFMFAYFGKDAWSDFTPGEVRAARIVFATAPPNSLLIDGTLEYPTQFEHVDRFTYVTLGTEPTSEVKQVLADPAKWLREWMTDPRYAQGYLIITKSQIAEVEATGQLPRGSLQRAEQQLLAAPGFKVLYHDSDALLITVPRTTTTGAFAVNGQRLIVAWSVTALVMMAAMPGAPLTLLVVIGFLLCCPGIVISGHLGIDDRAFSAMLLVGSSLALDALVAESLVYLHVFTGTRVVAVLAAIAVGGALLRRPVPSAARPQVRAQAGHVPAPQYELDFDRSMPVLLVRIGRYPVYHGGVCAIRSFGRVGVPVHAIVEDRLTPAAASRYLESAHVWPTTGGETEEFLVEGLRRIGDALGTRALAIPTDDESAVLLAEHGDVLREHFVYPAIESRLPRRLASKEGLHIMCGAFGVPQPDAFFPRTVDDIYDYAARATFPIVVKNVEPFARLQRKAVGGTTVVQDRGALFELASTFPSPRSAMFQEYIPRDDAEDWIFQTYCNEDYAAIVPFTGIKLRSWPPHAGVTTYARAVRNEELEELSVNFCRDLGYRGVCDLDWRFDRRDGRYKLVDFNPRPGAQFELFATEAGVDVVRAMHLDLTGRPVPPAPPLRNGIRIEHLDLPSSIAYRGRHEPVPADLDTGGRARHAWAAPDDPVPFLVMAVRVAAVAIGRSAARLVGRAPRPQNAPAPTPAPVAPAPDRPAPRRRRQRLALAAALGGAVVAAGTVVLATTGGHHHTVPPPARVAPATLSVAHIARDTVTVSFTPTHSGGPVSVVATQAPGAATPVWSTARVAAGQRVLVVLPFPTGTTTVTVDGLTPSGHPLELVLDPAALQARLGIHCSQPAPADQAACAWLGS